MKYIFNKEPDPVGWFYFGPCKTKIATHRKPRWLTRFMLHVFFEVQWLEKSDGYH